MPENYAGPETQNVNRERLLQQMSLGEMHGKSSLYPDRDIEGEIRDSA